MGDHHMFGKGIFLEGSAHIPMIIRAPSGPWDPEKPMAGKRVDTLVTLADVMPTILSIACVETPKSVDGSDMLSYVDSPDPDRPFYGNSGNRSFSIVDGSHKYLLSRWGGGELLFNLEADPQERSNLSNDTGWQERKAELKKKLLEKMVSVASPGITNGEFDIQPVDELLDPTMGNRWPGFHSTTYPCDLLH